MQKACDVVELKWVLRRALAILNTLEVRIYAARSMPSSISDAQLQVQVGQSNLLTMYTVESNSNISNVDIMQPWRYHATLQLQVKAPLYRFLQIEDTPDYFRTVIKAGGIMDVVEQYPWTGQEQQHSRRDKRAGHHHGKVVRTDRGPAIQ